MAPFKKKKKAKEGWYEHNVQLLVMKNGQLEEKGIADSVYENPQKEYTKKLIDAIPKGL